MKTLTIGIPVYDDYDGAYFTIQSLRLYHDTSKFNISVVNNNPKSDQGILLKKLARSTNTQYTELQSPVGTAAAKNAIFKGSKTKYTACIDSHVLLAPRSIEAILNFYDEFPECNDLIHGPLICDDLSTAFTHLEPTWGSLMCGQWARNSAVDNESFFEISAMGMGAFVCKTDEWLGFNPLFKGFGGEEVYIHNKFKAAGRRVICVSDLKWNHKFNRGNPVSYPNIIEDRLFNYAIGSLELYGTANSLFMGGAIAEFKKYISSDIIDTILVEATNKYTENEWN
jgi:glycosyltransferase involved in cell wall biosynthesis